MFLLNKPVVHSQLRKTTILISSSYHHYHDRLLSPLHRFSTVVETQNPNPKPHFMVEYLINSCGVSPDKANTASKHLTKLKSTSEPDSVLTFLKHSGFSNADIAKLLSKYPKLLATNVDKTLKPKFAALRKMGFSESELVQLASNNPAAVVLYNLQPKIDYWRSLLGTNDNLLKVFRKDNYLICCSVAKKVAPNLSLLRECGVSDRQIHNIIMTIPRLVGRRLDSFKAMLERVKELGFSCVANNTRAAFDKKINLLRTLGWSEVEVMSAFRKQPRMFNLTEDNLRRKMEFFVKEVGFDVSSLVCNPAVMSLSLERRLRPRHSILRLLKRDEWPVAKVLDFKMTEETFMKRYVDPQKEKDPGLYGAYVAARAGYSNS